MCDVSPLEGFYVSLVQPYMCKRHVVYESQTHSVIITLGKIQYRIPEVVPKATISLVSTKQFKKVIIQTRKCVISMIHTQSEHKILATSKVTSA